MALGALHERLAVKDAVHAIRLSRRLPQSNDDKVKVPQTSFRHKTRPHRRPDRISVVARIQCMRREVPPALTPVCLRVSDCQSHAFTKDELALHKSWELTLAVMAVAVDLLQCLSMPSSAPRQLALAHKEWRARQASGGTSDWVLDLFHDCVCCTGCALGKIILWHHFNSLATISRRQ